MWIKTVRMSVIASKRLFTIISMFGFADRW